jgi:glycine/D-amino acid oxidase-like deaminating enzyme
VPGTDGLSVATGHDAVGIILSPGTTELIVNWLLDGATELLEPFRPDRFG